MLVHLIMPHMSLNLHSFFFILFFSYFSNCKTSIDQSLRLLNLSPVSSLLMLRPSTSYCSFLLQNSIWFFLITTSLLIFCLMKYHHNFLYFFKHSFCCCCSLNIIIIATLKSLSAKMTFQALKKHFLVFSFPCIWVILS
uniref:Uncharacterized protein n=1 Tax=Myotis myotis TaxID=51298 RepID=A0A7J8ALH9_MYOMY|nr:hypothetical protein mMyoMyo1_007895 [Myotis myotis]